MIIIGDFNETEDSLEKAQFHLALVKPINFPDWVPLWEEITTRLFRTLQDHTGTWELCNLPPLLPDFTQCLNLHYAIFIPHTTSDLQDHSIKWCIPDTHMGQVMRIMEENEMRELPVFDVGKNATVEYSDFKKFLDHALVDVRFGIIHSEDDCGTHSFKADILDIFVIDRT